MFYDTILLRTFAAICDSGSFTKAAHEVGLTQSAVSLHIKRLEDQVGLRLIIRNARGVKLTENGEILLSYARRILALHKEAGARLGNASGNLVRIGAPEYFDLHTLATLLEKFSSAYPAIKLQIELGIGPDIASLLEAGELDLAIVNYELGEGDGTVLCREKRVWASAPKMQLDSEKPVPLALFPSHCGWRQLAFEQLDSVGRTWTVVLQSAGTKGILAAVEAGLAITLFPANGVPNNLSRLDSTGFLPPLPDFEFVLRRGQTNSPAAAHLGDMIASFFQLSTALRPGRGMNYEERSNLLV